MSKGLWVTVTSGLVTCGYSNKHYKFGGLKKQQQNYSLTVSGSQKSKIIFIEPKARCSYFCCFLKILSLGKKRSLFTEFSDACSICMAKEVSVNLRLKVTLT